MRGLAILLALVLFLILAGLLWWLTTRYDRMSDNRSATTARWTAANVSAGGRTRVVVERSVMGAELQRQVLESREVGTIEDVDADYDRRLVELMDLARDRARLLNDQAARE